MLIDIDELRWQRSVAQAETGDKSAAIRAQETLLTRLIGQGQQVLDAPIINPKDPIKGLWDSLDRAARPGAMLSRRGKSNIRHSEDGGEAYTVVLCERRVPISENLGHLEGAAVDFISYSDGNNNYLKIFGKRQLGDSSQETSYLYFRTKDGRWERRDYPQSQEEAWAVAPQTRDEFIVAAALRNIHRNRIAATSFRFVPKPPTRDTIPPHQKIA